MLTLRDYLPGNEFPVRISHKPGKHNSCFDNNNNKAILLIDPRITQNWHWVDYWEYLPQIGQRSGFKIMLVFKLLFIQWAPSRENLFKKKINFNENGILLPKLSWPTVRKKYSCDQEKLLKFEAEGQEFTKLLRSLGQFIQTAVKGQNNFW